MNTVMNAQDWAQAAAAMSPQPHCTTLSIPPLPVLNMSYTTFANASVTVAAAGTQKSMSLDTKKKSVPLHKNGLPIKSAMKSPVLAEVKTNPLALCRPSSIRSHSSPTPLTSPKYVHFNTQLEHVRLFLQGETPSCVSERETIVDARQNNRSTSNIKLTLPNWTSVPVDSFRNVDGVAPLRFEKAFLSEDQTELHGKILVQNIAFHKHVSVRFTVDFWQTQSEVSAEFEQSIQGTSLDRFKFIIPLEMERSMVEKTFCLAIRYQVIGREFWDSNNGMNYQIECKRVVVVAPQQPAVSSSDLSKQMNSLLLSANLPEYTKPALKKNLANRYDLSTSLSAAYSQPIAIPTTRSIPSKVDESMFMSTKMTVSPSQTAYRPSEYISPPVASSPHDHHSLYASSPKFLNQFVAAASPPEHFHLGFDQVSSTTKRGARNSWNAGIESPVIPSSPSRPHSFPSYYGAYSSSLKSSAPIAIPSSGRQSGHTGSLTGSNGRPAVGSSSYYDLVDRYCFYESSPHTSPYNSYPNSPPAPCIRG
ncbi:hypothetical protein BG006_011335 [Podila minutissima]|uniref:CBM21 domain-containing protein n=1 Tax=Podila minutissima TaxID=64525 RepID=A0A9P5VHM8_9FUNG|nr:hypothetical protein BG006_011335 [Podila minutissima]